MVADIFCHTMIAIMIMGIAITGKTHAFCQNKSWSGLVMYILHVSAVRRETRGTLPRYAPAFKGIQSWRPGAIIGHLICRTTLGHQFLKRLWITAVLYRLICHEFKYIL